MYSGGLLSRGSFRLLPLGGSDDGTLPSVKDEGKPIEALVIRRERKSRGTDSCPIDDYQVSRGSLQNCTNKRNATYLTEEEYDEDLAQLDILLHYVNNLSASLEFLQWEKKRISTDLVPTLLTMYDALYAKFSESSHLTCPEVDGEDSIPKEATKDGDESERTCRENEKNKNMCEETERELFILEPDNLSERKPLSLEECQGCRCQSSSSGKNCRQCHKIPTLEVVENDYDIPESVERDTDSIRSCSPRPPSGIPFLKTSSPASSFRMSKDRSRFRSLIEDGTSSPSKHNGSGRSYRPVSVISSSSSSSSSSNSLPRGPAGGLASYMASAESLNDNDNLHSDTDASRRRDRSLKARREKALRAGSDDSGVQCHIISLPAPPSNKPRYCDPNLHYMDRVVLEIVETEQLYVRDLKDVIEGYLEYWRNNSEDGVSASTIECLFSNIEQIYMFNRCFLSELEECGTDPVGVAKCFVRNNAGFAIYTEYCTNYPRTVSLLTDLMREEKSMRACRERQLALCHTLPLGSYLLKPVQRVLKYHLLLGNIVKNFNKEHSGHLHIWNALSAMTGIAHHINDMKRRHEHAIRVQEIQSLLYGWQGEDLTTYGELAAEGNFKMFGFKGLRHVFLFDKMLLITKRKDENFLVYKAHIMCSDLMLIESIPGEPLSFHVIPFDNPKCQYTLECRNLEQKREWTLQLKRVILENYSAAIPAHARQLVMELGQAKSDNLSGSDWKGGGGGRKTHHAPEYLERRKDKRRTSEGGFNSRLRIRRSSRTRKNKEEKDSRSRSVSRSRVTDEEEEKKHSTSVASPGEKSRLRLPMWRRRSEPFVKAFSISSPQKLPTSASFTEEYSNEKEVEESVEKSNERRTEEPTEVSPSERECEQLFDQDTCDENEGENLEHIVSQLLQHQLQMQQIILNKQRRGLLRKKKFGPHYETSDTENDDGGFESPVPPLPTSPPPSLMSNQTPMPFPSEYKTLSLPSTEREKQGATLQIASRNGSDFDIGENKTSNYDNLLEVWGGDVSTYSERDSLLRVASHTEDSSNSNKLSIRRTHSLSNSSIHSKDSHKVSNSQISEVANISGNGLEMGPKERPATIAIYDDSGTDKLSESSMYEEDIKHCDPSSKYSSKQSQFSLDNLVNIHPEHKIYSKAMVSKSSLKNVLNKLTWPKAPHKTVSEPSNSLSNIYANSEFDTLHRKTGLVSCMARQCSRTLKERIKQIRTEDWDVSNKSPLSSESLFGLSSYKQGSSSVGARLAAVNEPSDYAVPVIHPHPDKITGKSELRPDSVLSSSSSNSSGRESETRTIPEVGDTSGDSFYEKSFEAIESFLDDEMFRDSAIYSDQEDGQDTLGGGGGTLSPKHSFSYKYRSSFRGDSRSTSIFTSFSKTKASTTAASNITEEQHLVNGEIQTSVTRTSSKDSKMLTPPPSTKKVPPPVPAKPDTSIVQKFRLRGALIQQQLKTFEERIKSPQEFSDSTQDTSSPSRESSPSKGEQVMSKGWVKQVVGKLQQ